MRIVLEKFLWSTHTIKNGTKENIYIDMLYTQIDRQIDRYIDIYIETVMYIYIYVYIDRQIYYIYKIF